MSEDAGFDVCVLHLLVCVCVFSAHWVTVSVFDNVCVCVSNQLCEENTPTSLSYLAPRSPPIGRCAVVRAAPPLAGKARRRQFVAVAKILLLGSRLLLGDVWCIMDGWISRGGANLKCWWLDSRSSVRLCRSLSRFLALYCHRSLSLSLPLSITQTLSPLLSPIQICFNGQSRLYKVSHSAGIDITGGGGFFKYLPCQSVIKLVFFWTAF